MTDALRQGAEARPETSAPAAPLAQRARSLETALFLTGLAASLAILAVMAWPMFHGLLCTYDDLGKFHIPTRAYYAKCLADGRDFNWFPNMYCGFYLQGEGQVGMYHPLHRLLYSTLSLTTAFNIELFLSYPVTLLGMFVFLRRLRLARDAAMFGALAFAFSGFNLLHFVHMQAIATVSHLPWLLVAADVSLKSARRRTAAFANLAIALLVASQVLLGYPQYVWMSALIVGLYVLFIIREGQSAWRLAPLAAAALFGVLMGGIQLIPTYDAMKASERMTVDAYNTFKLSLHPLNLVQLVGPFLFDGRVVSGETMHHTHEYGLYDGAAVFVVFLLAAIGAVKLGGKRRIVIAASLLALAGLILALGRNGCLYVALSRLPVIGFFRAPTRYILLVHFGLAVAAAAAFEALRESGRTTLTRHARLVLVIVPAASIVAALLAGWPSPAAAPKWAILARLADKGQGALLVGPVLMTFAALAAWAALRGARWALAGIIVFTAIDLGVYGLTYANSSPPRTLESLVEGARLPQVAPFFRVEQIPSYTNMPALGDCFEVTGYSGLPPAKALDYTRAPAQRVASAAFVMLEAKATDTSASPFYLLPVPKPMPRARLVAKALVTRDPKADIEKIDIETAALAPVPLGLEDGPLGVAIVTKDLPGDIELTADAPSRQLLVLSESYHAGWRVAVDGRPAALIPVYGDFIGVVVDKGRHEVALHFRPGSLRIGAFVTKVGLALLAALFLVSLFVSRCDGSGPAPKG